ncbi:hypothetical protein [Streptomyces sp. NPDC046759]|uniref:hypothetical protein n=1 Tax=Streptomyces sp. NPDC046759 TaxID=3155019 RepID=UPI0033F22CDE
MRELVGLVAAPLHYRLLVTGETIGHEVADRAALLAHSAVRGLTGDSGPSA